MKKGSAEVAALKKAADERVRSRKQRREEQERNVQRKNAAASIGPDADDTTSHNESEEIVEGDADGGWGSDDDISEGSEGEGDSEESDGEAPVWPVPSAKRRKV